MVAVLATQCTWLYMQRLLVSCTQYGRLQGYLSSRSGTISACALDPYYTARCFMHWAYATSGTNFSVNLKTIPKLPAGMGIKQHPTAARVHQHVLMWHVLMWLVLMWLVLMWHVLMWPQTGQTSLEPHAVETTLKTDLTVAVAGSETRRGPLCPQRNREALVGSCMRLLAIPKPYWGSVACVQLG